MKMPGLFIVLLALAAMPGAEGQTINHPLPSASKDAKSGPAVGAPIPKFQAMDAMGKPQTFESLRGPKGLVLAFSRSADWCPYCKTQLVDLNGQVEAFRQKGFAVAALTCDSKEVLADFALRQKLKYTLLSDPDSTVIRAFEILNQNAEPGNMAYGIPFPGTYIVNERGIVTAKYFEEDYRERYSAAGILTREFGGEGIAKTTIDNPQLTLSYSATDSLVAPGRRITLIVDVTPKPKMHLYAPGVQGYIPVDWQMAQSKAWALLPVVYPPSRMLNLPVINETVPVFDTPVRIVRDVIIGQESELAGAMNPSRELTIEGTFRYQACDDKECYIPKTLQLTWMFKVGQLETDRVPLELRRSPK